MSYLYSLGCLGVICVGYALYRAAKSGEHSDQWHESYEEQSALNHSLVSPRMMLLHGGFEVHFENSFEPLRCDTAIYYIQDNIHYLRIPILEGTSCFNNLLVFHDENRNRPHLMLKTPREVMLLPRPIIVDAETQSDHIRHVVFASEKPLEHLPNLDVMACDGV